MPALLPWFFVALAVGALITGVYLFWESLRAALGATDPLEVQATAEADTRRRLLERKEALLSNLRDLKFDYDGGKISQVDFDTLDAKLRAQAKAVLKLLDEDVAPFKDRAEEMISERLVAAGRDPYRSSAELAKADADSESPNSDADSDSDSEGPKADADTESPKADSDSEGPKADSESPKAERVECPSCETLNEPDAVFCKKCGARVGEEAAEGEEAGEGA